MAPLPPAPGEEPPTPARVLAALERAALHRGDEGCAVPASAVRAHLAIAPRSRDARALHALLGALARAGAIRAARRGGVRVWALDAAGRRLLARARELGAIALPESPQHAAWRHARALAAGEIGRLRVSLAAGLADAERMLAGAPPPASPLWFELAERLRRDAWRVGSACHCLYEWEEPDDARADVDTGPPGRRNVALWNDVPR